MNRSDIGLTGRALSINPNMHFMSVVYEVGRCIEQGRHTLDTCAKMQGDKPGLLLQWQRRWLDTCAKIQGDKPSNHMFARVRYELEDK